MMRLIASLCFLLALASPAVAHEVRPAFLQITETEPLEYEFVWRRSIDANDLARISPIIPEDCSVTSAPLMSIDNQSRSETWTLKCESAILELEFSGLSGTSKEIFLDVRLIDRAPISTLLRSGSSRIDFDNAQSGTLEYFRIGIEHLIFGIDHVLFVICLFLFVRTPIVLIQTLTAFTLAHSLTLGLSVLEIAYLPQRPVEALIALSILFLCREYLLPEAMRSQLTKSAPWLMAFGLGLLHGFGFAGALGDIGLPKDQILPALFLFNIGIEAGQLIIVAGLGVIGAIGYAVLRERNAYLERSVVCVTGCYATFWTIERVALLV
ncbi:MAG: HupE/UreJ family protein [Pseudomonadota bacterium]